MPGCGLGRGNSFDVITAVNTKPGDVLYWHQAFGTTPWHKQQVANG